jgi:hypothetical protein
VSERIPQGSVELPKPPKKQSGGKPILTARFLDPRQVCGNGLFSHVYLPLHKYVRDVCDGIVMPPSVFGRAEDETLRLLERAASLGATDVLVCHAGQIETVKRFGLTPHGDFRLNVFNSSAARLYLDAGLRDVMLSPELTLPQIRDISAPKSVIVYGRLPLMLLTKPVEATSLTDKTGAVFPIITDYGCDHLYNSVPIYMADRERDLSSAGILCRHFIFTTETKAEAARVIDAYKNRIPPIRPDAVRRIK